MNKKWKSWGKQPNETMPRQRDTERCPRCEHQETSRAFYGYIIGFSDKPEARSSLYEKDCEGIMVFECPQCFTQFKCHLPHGEIFLINSIVKDNPDFMEVPGAKEAYLKMLAEVKGDEWKMAVRCHYDSAKTKPPS